MWAPRSVEFNKGVLSIAHDFRTKVFANNYFNFTFLELSDRDVLTVWFSV